MSIASEITRLQNIKTNIRSALVTQGVPAASGHDMADFSADILSISTGGGATITVTYSSQFYNKTMTCTKGSTTYTQTTTSSGSTTFSVAESGTWTITCNGVSRTVDVVLEYSTQMAITKTVTVYSAASDTVSFTDVTGAKTVTTNTSGQGSVSITFIPNSTITFTSSIAKKPNNVSQAYSKTITMTDSITTIKVMPDAFIYWYGCKSGLMLSDADLETRMTYSWRSDALNAGMSFTKNTNNIVYEIWQPYYTDSSAQRNHISQWEVTGSIDLSTYSHVKAIAVVENTSASREIVTSAPFTANPTINWVTTPSTIAYDDSITNYIYDTDISSVNSGTIAYMNYTTGTSSAHSRLTLSAIWLE